MTIPSPAKAIQATSMNVPVGENKVDTLGLDFQVSNSVSTLY
jgi:hypothetical protein